MSLAAGTRLGPYEVLGLIGAGGMGEVYEARDTRLERTVAIKVLPAHVSAEPVRRERFEREARTIAGLSHPHICTLHDVGEHLSPGSSQPTLYLVMERLTGETLAARLQKGLLPLRKALAVATEIADALAVAHRHGVVHRDLKPGNVMLTPAGAKLLDFGLAKLKGHGEQPLAETPPSAPTQLGPLTGEGTIVGTLEYMAPEQLEGKASDARTDIWALGAILYEMVTGKQAFEGESRASVVAAILDREPVPPSSLQPMTPPALELLVRRCLAKNPDNRWDSAHDLADALRWMRETGAGSPLVAARPRRRRRLRMAALVIGGAAVGVLVGAGATWLAGPATPPALLARPSLEVVPAEELNAGGIQTLFLPTPGGSRTALAWTPDGRGLVFVGRRSGVQQLYLRRLDATGALPIGGTEGAQVPAVSQDGQWVAFWANGTIRKLPLGGGPVMDLVPGLTEPPLGLAWDEAGRLYFGKVNGAIWVVPPDGAPAAVTAVGEAEVSHGLPCPLPAGRLLYTLRRRVWSWGDEEVVAIDLATGARSVLLKDAADARYVRSGHLVFLRRGQLFAVRFDARRLEVLGAPIPMLDAVAQALTAANAGDVTGAAQYAVSASGTLAWLPGSVTRYRDGALVTVDRAGHVAPLPTPVRSYGRPLRLSPGGRRLAVTIYELAEQGLWVYDLDRGTLSPLARGGEAACPIWSPDGQRLVFGWLAGGGRSLASQPADGTAAPRPIVSGPFCPSSFSPDGREVAAVQGSGDLVMVGVANGKASVRPVSAIGDTKRSPELSPDGRWLAYESNASGRFEVYVRPHGEQGSTQQVSVDGGQSPAWHPTGREIFFVSERDAAGKRWMMAARLAPGSPARIGRPLPLFAFDPRELTLACIPLRCYDVAPDGQRFYVVQQRTPPPQPTVTHINLIVDWFEELEAKVPAAP